MTARTALPPITVSQRSRLGNRMTPVDAMWYWFGTKFPTDQFLVYAFAGSPDVDRAVSDVLDRANASPDLKLRIAPRWFDVLFPDWCSADVQPDQVIVHAMPERTWQALSGELAGLIDRQLDPRAAAWKLHVYPDLSGVPGTAGTATVVVLQIAHPLADGLRSSALAGYLFGRDEDVPGATARPADGLIMRVVERELQKRRFADDVEAGTIPPGCSAVPALSTNDVPSGARTLRTVVVPASQIAGPTITVGAMAAIAQALSGYLRARGEDTSQLAAEVLMAKPGVRYAYNHFDAVGVGLHPDAGSLAERLALIARDLRTSRIHHEHPAFAANERVFAAVPAPLRWWGVKRLNPDARPTMVRGNTAVSSVHRGPADLHFGGCPVTMTCGYPSLSPVMGLTHGLHGIGDTLAVSVNTTESVITDLDEYTDRLTAALRPE
ncbi:WS/DGAT domain-containing protein [Mycobacterium sp.]|uniref:WS/DGAT domain-containing protein n=1 Tax=Mycobacterium sp. TaxID=1785 RepID=UPI002D8E715C|nr:WS/DGAT domain-containing protein [Mycobacterium sp.]